VATNGTWTGAASTVFDAAGNWAGGVVASGTGAIITITGVTFVPASNRPTTGTFHFVVASGITVADLSAWLNGAEVGDVTVNHASAVVSIGDTIYVTGNIVVTLGLCKQTGLCVNMGTLLVSAGAKYQVGLDSVINFMDTITLAGTAEVLAGGGLLTDAGIVLNGGTLDASAAGTSIGSATGISGSGAIKLSATSQGDGVLNLTSCTWTVAVGAVWQCEGTATWHFGAASVSPLFWLHTHMANVTLGEDLTVGAFVCEDDSNFSLGGKTLTVDGAGNFNGVDLGYTLGYRAAAGTHYPIIILADGGTWALGGNVSVSWDATVYPLTNVALGAYTLTVVDPAGHASSLANVTGTGNVTCSANATTITGLTCGTLTLTAAKTLTLAGTVRLGAAPVFGVGATLHLTNAAITSTATLTFNAAAFDAAHCDHVSCSMFSNGAAVLTLDRFPAQILPIQAWRGCIDGGNNHATAFNFHSSEPSDRMLLGVGD